MTSHPIVDRINRFGVIVILATAIVCTILGVVATLLGGQWNQIGEGLGGLYNLPILTLLATSALGVPALMVGIWGVIRGNSQRGTYLLAFIGPVLVLVVFLFFAHAIDPCDNGWWNNRTDFNRIPMCQRFGYELNIHNRFHLLMHTLPTWLAVIPYWFGLHRWLPMTFQK